MTATEWKAVIIVMMWIDANSGCCEEFTTLLSIVPVSSFNQARKQPVGGVAGFIPMKEDSFGNL